ncbi:3-oxo-5-alpha-steroid 4-dehydrogenase-domain-containing protein [Multifurca ochricompacta]|uniref:3-oxo-5-alpha-steroid 4-dehydrogenase-domain-containing protein n=1 Tax=Multifurca ochricompacta TaxID=376703 RepID=A0AAD4LYW8_9AGAM|nr:3-oxo-5-alpha-steroid 4-dehydrogenase-domain-containing protein [Multifurca ochricompacta]
MAAVTLTVSSTSKSSRGFPVTVKVDKPTNVAKVSDVKAALAARVPRLYVERQKLTLKGETKALDDDATLAAAGLVDGGEVVVKDLGPQVSWRTVFLTEYAGPLVIHPILYHLPNLFYRGQVQHSQIQKCVFFFFFLNFDWYTVHRFSHGTMPLRNIFKNSVHYHVFSGLFLAYPIYGPTYSGHAASQPQFLRACAAVWLFAQLSNLSTHLTLRNLRPPGTKTRAIPHGYGFGLISCPNYFFESVAWAAVAYMTGSWAAWLFWAVSTAQMASWAAKKQRAYKKEFGKDYPRQRKAMFPFLF